MKKIAAVFGLIGPPAAGKTTAANFFMEKAARQGYENILIVDSSKYLEELTLAEGLPTDRGTKQQLVAKLCEGNPYGVTDALYEKAMAVKADDLIILIDSVRPDSYRYPFRQAYRWQHHFPDIIFLFLDTPYETRFERYNHREILEGRRPISREEFYDFHQAASERDIDLLKSLVETESRIIDNDWSKEDLRILIDQFFIRAVL